MVNRAYIAVTVVLWLGSMTWLVTEKVLPTFYGGDSPVTARLDQDVPIAWEVDWSDHRVGYAASLRQGGVEGTTEIHNHIVLQDIPLVDFAPTWMKSAVKDLGNLKFSATTRMEFDSLDNFSAFESRIAVNDIAGIVKMSGRVRDSKLALKVQSGDCQVSKDIAIPNQSVLNEALFPDSKLPYLYEGREWQEEVYNPFANPTEPVERVHAKVVEVGFIEYNEERRRVMCVEYRSDTIAGVADKSRLRAQAWVAPEDGTVLRQIVYLANAELQFERLSEKQAYEIGRDFFRLPKRKRAAEEAVELKSL